MAPFSNHPCGPPSFLPRLLAGATLVGCVAGLTGCGATTATPARSPDPTAGPTTTTATTPAAPVTSAVPPTVLAGSLSLFNEPGDDYHSIDQLIAGADHTIDLTMYELADPQIEDLLGAAQRRGVSVRVLLDHAYNGVSVNQAAYAQLSAAGVPVRWASDTVIFHQKTLTVDDSVSAVMTGNLTSEYYPSTRDFTVIDRNPGAVAAVESVFASDWGGSPVAAGPTVDGLVWSPGSESALVGLIDSARSSIDLENEEMDSRAVESALEAAARRGVAWTSR
jgi:cardiolipin synthase